VTLSSAAFYKSLAHPSTGVFVCTDGVASGNCLSSGVPLNISTTLTLYSLRASTICARSNNSILSISDIGKPTQDDIDIHGLNLALNWLLNYTAEGLPAISSILYLFSNAQPGLGLHDWSIVAYQSLKSLVAFPIWEFSVNNFGDPFKETLPSNFSTSASLCKPYDKIALDPRAFIAYLVLQSTVLLFFCAVIILRLVYKSVIPELSAYPLVDFTAKLAEKTILEEHHPIWDLKKANLMDAESKEVVETLKDVQVIRRNKSEGHSLGVLRCRPTWP
jgi:hypothetical protein